MAITFKGNSVSVVNYNRFGIDFPVHKLIYKTNVLALRTYQDNYPSAMAAANLAKCTSSSNYSATYAAWKAFNKDWGDQYGWASASTYNTGKWIAIKLDNPMYITQIEIWNRQNSSYINGPILLEVYKAAALPTDGSSIMTTVRADPVNYPILVHWNYNHGTSSTSLTSNQGLKTLTTQAGLFYKPGDNIKVSYQSDLSVYMEGIVISYSGTTLTFYSYNASYTQTSSSWYVSYPNYNSKAVGMPGATSGATSDGCTILDLNGFTQAQYLIFNPYDYDYNASATYVAIGEIIVRGYTG